MRQLAKWQLDSGGLSLAGFESGAVIPWDYMNPSTHALGSVQPGYLLVLDGTVATLDFQVNVKLRALSGGGVVHLAIKKNGVQIAGSDCLIADSILSLSCSVSGVECVTNDYFTTELRTPCGELRAASSSWSIQAYG